MVKVTSQGFDIPFVIFLNNNLLLDKFFMSLASLGKGVRGVGG